MKREEGLDGISPFYFPFLFSLFFLLSSFFFCLYKECPRCPLTTHPFFLGGITGHSAPDGYTDPADFSGEVASPETTSYEFDTAQVETGVGDSDDFETTDVQDIPAYLRRKSK